MKRKIVMTAAAMAMVSCGIYEIGGDGIHDGYGGIWGGPVSGAGGAAGTMNTVCYMTAMDYQRGYDWRSDQARESVKCSLVVYADGIPIMKVPVGAVYETGSDPDMHRIIDGHLYTDYSTDSETIIKKDGALLFRYQGGETLCGMKVREDGVYTLGLSRNGSGFTYRKNGEIIVERAEGNVIGSLEEDGDTLCFAFSEAIRNADGTAERYYQVTDGKISQVALREDIKTVWDILPGRSQTTYLASLTGVSSPVMISGESMTSLSVPTGASMVSCRLFRSGDKVGAEGLYRLKTGAVHNAIWLDGKVVATFTTGNVISAMEVYEDGIFCAMNPSGTSGHGTIYRCGELFDMPEGFSVMGNGSMAVSDGILHVGLSSLDGERPLVWKDGQTDTLNVNGFISTVSVEPAD